MFLRKIYHSKAQIGQCNMTPIIDVVFLLIIFFMLVCQFIVAENFPVKVPDQCGSAQSDSTQSNDIVTVTVMKSDDPGGIGYAVGSERIFSPDRRIITEKITEAIDKRLKNVSADQRVICLRIDKDIRFGFSQYALAGIANSGASEIQLAAFKNKYSKPD